MASDSDQKSNNPSQSINTKKGLLVRKTSVELVEEILRKRIMLCELAPGAAIRQEDLAKELGVSRVPIREALRTLCSEGLVEIIVHKGTFVSKISIQQVQELYDLRLRLEPWLFEIATAYHTEVDMSHLENIVKEMLDADESKWSELNWEFHKRLYLASNHSMALNIVNALNEKTRRYLCLQVINRPIRMQANTEHLELIEIYRNHQSQKANQAMAQHISGAASQLIEIISHFESFKND
jgi:DNA-binding GntR family transcriptional regulator